MKICVHITYYQSQNNNRDHLFKKIVSNYLQFDEIDIFIHTNKKVFFKKKSKNVKCIIHKLKKEHPFYLSWKCRKLMEKQKKNYDYYIYTEDDILFTKKNFIYWKENFELCKNYNYNLGFIRVEDRKSKGLFAVDVFHKFRHFIKLKNKKFAVNDVNPYCAMWIMDNDEFNKFIKIDIWKFKWKKNYQAYGNIREMSAMGLHGININFYKSTLIPLNNKKLDKDSIIIHLDNRYSITKHGPGSLKFKDILNVELIELTKYYRYKIFIKKILKKLSIN